MSQRCLFHAACVGKLALPQDANGIALRLEAPFAKVSMIASDVTLGVNSTILIGSNTMQMKSCNITSGTVKIPKSVEEALITINRFQDVMFDIQNNKWDGKSGTTIRNNKGKYTVDRERINRCDQAGTGVGIHMHMNVSFYAACPYNFFATDAGCDARASCQMDRSGGVQCTCDQPLEFKEKDGSMCEQSAELGAFFQSQNTNVVVYKPLDAKRPFIIEVAGEEPAHVDVQSSASYVVIDPPCLTMPLSRVKSRNEAKVLAGAVAEEAIDPG